MRISTLALTVLIAVGSTAVQAQSINDVATPDMRSEIGAEIDQSMATMLDGARRDILDGTGPIIKLPYICPHAMRAMAAIAAGKIDVDRGARLFIAGLEMDRAEMISMKIGATRGIDLSGSKGFVSVELGGKVNRKQLAGLMELGQAYLK